MYRESGTSENDWWIVKVLIRPGEVATIGDGPMRGVDAEVLTVDPSTDLAQVRVHVHVAGRLRSGIAVVSLSALHRPGQPTATAPNLRALVRRGRPRQVTPEMAERMASMYASGQYTHARIATVLGVSKSTVSHYLRHEGSTFAADADVNDRDADDPVAATR